MMKINNCPLCNYDSPESFLRGKDYFLTMENFDVMSCSYCSLKFTSPLPSSEKIGDYYKSENYISHSENKKGLINKLYHIVKSYSLKSKYNLINSYKNGGNLLDIGCGSGAFPEIMKRRGWKVIAIEPDAEARSFAINHYKVDARSEDEITDLTHNSFDIITLWHVLEHVYDLDERMLQIQKLLSEDGILILALPNPASWDAAHYGEFWAAYDLPRHLYHFPQKSIEFLASKYQLKLIDKRPMKFDACYVSILSEKYKGGNSLRGFINGLRSNIWAMFNRKEYSSIIYILKKEIC